MHRHVFKITKPLAKLKNEEKINKNLPEAGNELPAYTPLDQRSQLLTMDDISKPNPWAIK